MTPRKSAPKSAPGRPFARGTDPRRGRGPSKGAPNAGRPPNALRALSREVFEAYLIWAQKRVQDPDIDDATMDRIGNTAGKYGLGTTITETDTKGEDVPRVRQVWRVGDRDIAWN